MAQEPDLLITAGFSDAQLVAESNKVVAAFKKRGEEAQKAFQDATGRVTNTAAARGHMRELDRLSKAYDPVYRAASRYEAEVKKLDRALDIGAITQSQYTQKVAEAARSMQQATAATGTGTAAMAAGAARAQTAVQSLGRGAEAAGTGMGRWRSQVQNTAFQLQDFVVQVQGGTAATTAFAQQAPQLLGGFGALGAVLGLVAALAVPVGVALFSLGRESEDAAKMAEAFDNSLQAARSAMDDFNATINTQALGSIDRLIEKYGRADEAVRDLEDRMRSAFRENAFTKTGDTVRDTVLGSLIGADSPVAAVFGEVVQLREQAELAQKSLEKLMDGQTLGAFRTENSYKSSDFLNFMGLQDDLEQAQEGLDAINDKIAEIGITPEQIATFRATYDALRKALEAQNFNDAISSLDTIQALLRDMNNKTLADTADQLDQVQSELRQAAVDAGELPPELAAAAAEAAAMADYITQAVGAVNSLKGAIANLGISNIGKAARLAALQAGQSAGEAGIAGRVAERRAELEEAFSKVDTDSPDIRPPNYERELAQYEQGLREELNITEQIKALEDNLRPTRSGRSGGGGGAAKAERPRGSMPDVLSRGADQIAGLEREISLLGKSNQEIAVARARWAALDEAKRQGIPVTAEMSAQIEAQAAQFGQLTAELEKAEAAQQKFDQAIDGVADAMAGALVAGESLRDGLAQVLKGIASDILQSGIRAALSSQFSGMGGGGGFLGSIVGSFFGGDPLTSALRGAGLPAVASYAGGGYTPSGPRSGGLDGMGGRLALVHPNEKITDMTKPGTGGSGTLVVDLSPDLVARILSQSEDQAIRISQKTAAAQAKALPAQVAQINANPRRR